MFPAVIRDPAFDSKLVVDEEITALAREQYQRLAAGLHHLHDTGRLASVMIASAVPREGKTLTAANLALTFSESYHRRVLLVDADLRRPNLHELFGIDNTEGLGDLLGADEERPLPARTITPRLSIVPAGSPMADPIAGLTSPRLSRLLAAARESFDWIIVDTPPVALLSDAKLLASMVDGAVLVIRAGSTDYSMVNRAVDAIGRARIVGVVLNAADPRSVAAARYYQPGRRENR